MANPLDSLTNRQYAATLLYDMGANGCDIDAQFTAIRGLLGTLESDENTAAEGLCRMQEKALMLAGSDRDRAEDFLIDHYNQSVYDDAARSMAAVSMLAPFIEMLFTRLFSDNDRQNRYWVVADQSHIRWGLQKHRWSCEFWAKEVQKSGDQEVEITVSPQRGIIKAIPQLCEAARLQPYLPSDYSLVIYALFEYRHKMFHNGFEWPIEKRVKFHGKMNNSGCPSAWFNNSTWGNTPWVCYITREFIRHCLDTIEKVLEGIGAYDRWVDAQGNATSEVGNVLSDSVGFTP